MMNYIGGGGVDWGAAAFLTIGGGGAIGAKDGNDPIPVSKINLGEWFFPRGPGFQQQNLRFLYEWRTSSG